MIREPEGIPAVGGSIDVGSHSRFARVFSNGNGGARGGRGGEGREKRGG